MREHERIRFELGLCIRCEKTRENCRKNKQTCRECGRKKSNQVLMNYHGMKPQKANILINVGG